MLRAIGTAFTFLTVLRVPTDSPPTVEEVGRSAWAFPLVGAAIGLVLVGAWQVLYYYLPLHVLALIILALWIVLTGGLHLDGWSDCCDALAASVPLERRLEILKDSRLGTFGAVGLVVLLALKAGAMATTDFPLLMLFLSPVVGRGAMVIVARGSMQRGEGMAARFIAGLHGPTVAWATVFTLGAALGAGGRGVIATGVALIAGFGLRRLAQSRLHLVNGDVLGGVCELSEAVVLLVACVHTR